MKQVGKILLIDNILLCLFLIKVSAQGGSSEYKDGFTVKFDSTGNKYISKY